MKTIRILHLYGDAMDLYGDVFNVVCICNHLEAMGIRCEIDNTQLGDRIDFAPADLVYIGHGKARNLAAVAPHFLTYGADAKKAVEDGKLFLVTGNARLLFGREFETPDGGMQQGVGLFDYVGRETGKVFTADIAGELISDPSIRTYGFVNRTQFIEGKNLHPLFRALRGPGDGEQPDGWEGTLYNGFCGTWQMGPLLPRNPALLRILLQRLAGEDFRDYDDTLERKALELTLSEFKGL